MKQWEEDSLSWLWTTLGSFISVRSGKASSTPSMILEYSQYRIFVSSIDQLKWQEDHHKYTLDSSFSVEEPLLSKVCPSL